MIRISKRTLMATLLFLSSYPLHAGYPPSPQDYTELEGMEKGEFSQERTRRLREESVLPMDNMGAFCRTLLARTSVQNEEKYLQLLDALSGHEKRHFAKEIFGDALYSHQRMDLWNHIPLNDKFTTNRHEVLRRAFENYGHHVEGSNYLKALDSIPPYISHIRLKMDSSAPTTLGPWLAGLRGIALRHTRIRHLFLSFKERPDKNIWTPLTRGMEDLNLRTLSLEHLVASQTRLAAFGNGLKEQENLFSLTFKDFSAHHLPPFAFRALVKKDGFPEASKRYRQLSLNQAEALATAALQAPNLKHLALEWTWLTPATLEKFLSTLQSPSQKLKRPPLTYLSLVGNGLTPDAVPALCRFLENYPLKYLDINNNKMGDALGQALLEILPRLKTLGFINLSYSLITPPTAQKLMDAAQKSNLRFLKIKEYDFESTYSAE